MKEPDNNSCGVCEDLLRQLEKFFTIVEGARLRHTSDWLTVDDIAAELKISKSVVYQLIRNGELDATDVAENHGKIAQRGHYRIKRSSLNQYLEAKKVRPLPNKQVWKPWPKRFPNLKNYLEL